MVEDVAAVETAKVRTTVLKDKWAGNEQTAIDIVKNFQVLSPEYVDAFAESKASGKPLEMEKSKVTIESLVNQNFLEKRFNMNFLRKGEWRALHLDTDSETGGEQIPDPEYEVYLDYHDESVVVGPVWVVDVEKKVVIPRNDMASVFDRNEFNYSEVNENLKRPSSVVRAIISHKFEGIDLGGVFLLHFIKLTSLPKHSEDQIIGWTVMQDFQDDFLAYFQWKELGEVQVAKFRFNWADKRLEPRGLLASELMSEGESMGSIDPANIYPSEYIDNPMIPRHERWVKTSACRQPANRVFCTAFARVLEQQEFMRALSWLLTNGKADGSRKVELCKSAKKCRWSPKPAGSDVNPENRPDLFEVDYEYELNGRAQTIRFLVDDKNDKLTPLDKISQWAYWSVMPRV